MTNLNELFNYEGKIYTAEEAKRETFAFIDKQAEILREELKQIAKEEYEYEKI